MSIEEHGPTQETLLPRQQFGRYEIVRLLGAGAFAAVYAAHDPALDATVAVKVLGDNHCVDPEIRARFITEARLLRRVGTTRLVPVFDIGEQDGQPYFVMELMEGGTLADRMIGSHADLPTIRRIVVEVAECLEAVHLAGIVHRDLKPSNILIRPIVTNEEVGPAGMLIGPGEQLVLGDFGIAREADASNLTRAMGTEGFMAPEQRTAASSIDQRADIYAATAIVAALATSTSNPSRSTPADIAALTPQLRNALAQGMAVDPGHRPRNATEWRTIMLQALADSGPSAPQPRFASSRSALPEAGPTGHRRRRSGVVMAALAVLLALVGGGTALVMSLTGAQPRIVGPEVIAVGQAVEYRADVSPGAEHYWVDWNGVRHDGAALRVESRGPGVLPIRLIEVTDTRERTTDLVIKVEE